MKKLPPGRPKVYRKPSKRVTFLVPENRAKAFRKEVMPILKKYREKNLRDKKGPN